MNILSYLFGNWGTVEIDGCVYFARDIWKPAKTGKPKIHYRQERVAKRQINYDIDHTKTRISVRVCYDPSNINLPRNTTHIYKDFLWGYTISKSRNTESEKKREEEKRWKIVTEWVGEWVQSLRDKGYINLSDIKVTFQAESLEYSGDPF